jgi:hypothetical protein
VKVGKRWLAAVGVLAVGSGVFGAMSAGAASGTTSLACDLTVRSKVVAPLDQTEDATKIAGSEAQPPDPDGTGPLTKPAAETCTGPSQSTTGDLMKASLSLKGNYNCPDLVSLSPTAVRFSGTLTLTYMNGPAPDKHYSTVAYVRADPTATDVLDLQGIVTKGIGVGQDVSGQVGFAAFADPKYTTALTFNQVNECATGGGPQTIPYLVLFTDGVTPVLENNVSSEISLSLP